MKSKFTIETVMGVKVCLPYFLHWMYNDLITECTQYRCCHYCERREKCRTPCTNPFDYNCSSRILSPIQALKYLLKFKDELDKIEDAVERADKYETLIRKELGRK